MSNGNDKFSKNYSDDGFWMKLKKYSKKIGGTVIFKALQLYYVLQKPDVPTWAKAEVIAVLGYFISPLDAIPDLTPVIGYSDDLGVLVLALVHLQMYVDDEVINNSQEKFKGILGSYYNFNEEHEAA